MEKKFNRVLCLALALIMVIGFVPMHHAHAVESSDPTHYWVKDAETGAMKNAVTGKALETAGEYGYVLDNSVNLDYQNNWAIEFKTTAESNLHMYLSTTGTTDKDSWYLFRYSGCNYLSFGYFGVNNGSYQNSAATATSGGHTYYIMNRYDSESGNVVYLSVDGATPVPMNNYWVGGTNKNTTTDILNEKSFTFTHMGTPGYPWNPNTEYMKIWTGDVTCPHFDFDWAVNAESGNWERTCSFCGYSESRESISFRWDNVDGTMVSAATSEDIVENTLTANGTIGYKMAYPAELKYTENWAIEFAVPKGGNKSMPLSETGSSSSGFFLFYPDTDTSANRLYIGANTYIESLGTSKYLNMGGDFTINATESNEIKYRVMNYYNATSGTNSIWVSANDGEPVEMKTMYYAHSTSGVDQTTTHLNKDFNFGFLGTSGFGWRNDTTYLQIWLNNAPCEHSYDVAEDGLSFVCKMCGDKKTVESYYWKNVDGTMTSVTEDGATLNTLKTNGNIGYEMTYPAALYHNNEWAVEFKFSPTGSSMPLSQAGNVNNGNQYLYWNGGFLGLGYVDSSAAKPYQNFAASVSNGADTKVRLMNKVNADGTNMVYMSLNDAVPVPMNRFYQNTGFIEAGNNGLNEMDFVFKFLGSSGSGFAFDNSTQYMRIWLDDQPCPHYNADLTANEDGDLAGECSFCGEELFEDVKSFRWENVNGTMVSVSGEGITQNTLTKNSTFGYKMAHPAVLKYTENWAIEFDVPYSGARSTILTETGNVGSGHYLFYPGSESLNRIYFGRNEFIESVNKTYYLNMGTQVVTKPDAINTYRIMNRYDEAKGTNTIWISVNDATPIKMDNMYHANSLVKEETATLLNRDFTFGYMGSSGYGWRNDTTYLQIWTEDAPCIHSYTTSLSADNHMEKVCDWCGHVAESVEHYSFRWEQKDGTMVSATGSDIMENPLTVNAAGNVFEMEYAANLDRTKNWEILFDAGPTRPHFMPLSESGKNSEGMFIYSADIKRVYLGTKKENASTFNNLSVNSSVDLSTADKYCIKNVYDADEGTSTLWMSINDGEFIKMDTKYSNNGTANFEADYTNKNLVFKFIGAEGHAWARNSIDFIEIWPNGRPSCDHEFGAWTEVDGQLKRTCNACGEAEFADFGVDLTDEWIVCESFDDTLSAAAAEGATIRLFEDVTYTGDLELPANVDVDLNEHTLTADRFFAPNGSNIIDTTSGCGALVVPEDAFIAPNNTFLPVWTGTEYRFADYNGMQVKTRVIDEDTTKFYFLPDFPAEFHDIIRDAYVNGDLELDIRLSWTKAGVSESKDLKYSVQNISDFYNGYTDEAGYAYAFVVTVNGTNLVEDLSFQPLFKGIDNGTPEYFLNKR